MTKSWNKGIMRTKPKSTQNNSVWQQSVFSTSPLKSVNNTTPVDQRLCMVTGMWDHRSPVSSSFTRLFQNKQKADALEAEMELSVQQCKLGQSKCVIVLTMSWSCSHSPGKSRILWKRNLCYWVFLGKNGLDNLLSMKKNFHRQAWCWS